MSEDRTHFPSVPCYSQIPPDSAASCSGIPQPPEPQCILVTQRNNDKSTRTVVEYANVKWTLQAICQEYEDKMLERLGRLQTYTTNELFEHLDSMVDLHVLIRQGQYYILKDKEWIKDKLYEILLEIHKKRSAAKAASK